MKMIGPVFIASKIKATYAAYFTSAGVIIMQAVQMVPENYWGVGLAVLAIVGGWKWVKGYIEKLEKRADESNREIMQMKDDTIRELRETIRYLREGE